MQFLSQLKHRSTHAHTHLDDVPSVETDLVCLWGCEGEQSHSLHAEDQSEPPKQFYFMNEDSECSCVIGAQRGEGTPSQDDIISVLSARRRSLTSCSLVNEESFLSACVPILPCDYSEKRACERTRGVDDCRPSLMSAHSKLVGFDGAFSAREISAGRMEEGTEA